MRRVRIVAVVTLLAAGCGGEVAGLAVPAPTSTTSTTTTTVPAPALSAAPGETLVATATVDQIHILSELPEPGATPAVDLVDPALLPPISTGPRAEVPLPSVELGAGHRYLVDDGWVIVNPTDFANPVVFPVTAQRGYWLRVPLPVRPAGQEGWVRWSDVELSRIDTRVEVSLSERRLRAVQAGRTIVDAPVTIGASGSPTPTGRYFITDDERRTDGSAYGPWVLALSGFSQAMDSFDGGAPIIALHGTNRPDLMGAAASNGCLRLRNDDITLLRESLPLGTPVDIRA